MTRAPTAGPVGLLRVTATSRVRRVDLLLPDSVPVAELVPVLARSVGLLDPSRGCAGFRLVTAAGRPLAPDETLERQGVEDGALLAVCAELDDLPSRIHDDLAEAMADVVESDLRPWRPEDGRRAALAAATVLMMLGAAVLPTLSDAAAPGALGLAGGLLGLAVVVSRVRHEQGAAAALAWTSTAYAAVAGMLLVPDAGLPGASLAGAGAGATAAGLLAWAGLGAGRVLMVPTTVVGSVALGTGLAMHVAGIDDRVVLATTLVLVVLAGPVLPWLALGTTRTGVGGEARHVAEVDLPQVRADARAASELLVAISAATGSVMVLLLPFAVRLGAAGTALALVSCGLVLVRTRQHRTAAEVRVGLGSGLTGAAVVVVSVLVRWPGWRPSAAGCLLVAGAVLFAATLLPVRSPVRRRRLADLAETLGLLALLPLFVLATGLLPAVGR